MAFTVPKFCQRLGIGHSTFWKYHRLGKIRTINIGKRVLVPTTELQRILSEGIARG
jgi:predicted site-specific integrase-resolvase